MAVVVRSAEGEVQVGAEPAGVARVGLAQRRTALEREDLEDALGDEMSEEEILGDVDKCCGSALSRALGVWRASRPGVTEARPSPLMTSLAAACETRCP